VFEEIDVKVDLEKIEDVENIKNKREKETRYKLF